MAKFSRALARCAACTAWVGLSAAIVNPSPAAAASPATTLTLTEGTQLGAAADPRSGDVVLALHGALYRLAPGEREAAALTDLMEDAWEPHIAPDGSFVVYQSYRRGAWDLRRLALERGAQPEVLTDSLFDDREPHVSPDGTRILFSSDRGGSYDVWLLALGDGAVRRLTDGDSDEFAPAWAPDGSRFAYVERNSGGDRIMVAALDGAEPRLLHQAPGSVAGLAWRPDGGALGYQVLWYPDGGAGRTAMKLLHLGSGRTEVLSGDGADVFPFRGTWLDDGSLLFTADGGLKQWRPGGRVGERPFAVTVTLDAAPYQRRRRDHDDLSARRALGLSTPALAPDGRQVAFTALGDLWLWRPDAAPGRAGSLRRLTDDPYAQQTPAWSADGRRLLFVDDRAGHVGLRVMDPAQGTVRTIDVPYQVVSYPSWSPDGRRLAFFTDVPGNPLLHVVGQLTVFDVETGEATRLLSPMPPQPISWSADGRRVVTVRLAPFTRRFREGLQELVVAQADGSGAHGIVPVPHRNVSNATLSPRGDAVAYTQAGMLHILDLDENLNPAGEPRLVVDSLADSPHWGGGGDAIVFQAAEQLKRLTVKTGRVEDISPTLSWRRDLPTASWVLRAGRLYDGRAREYRENVDVHIRGHRIAAIEPADPATTLPLVDASDKAVIPGLFESHTHIGDNSLSEVQGRVWLAYGVTSVRDPGSNPYLAKERQEAWDSGRRIGPRTYLTAHNIDGRRVYYAVVEGIVSDEHLELSLERARRMDMDFLKTYVRLPDHQQKRVVEFGHGIGIPVTSHELLPAAAYGVDHIEHIGGTSRRGYATKTSLLGRSYQDVVEVLTASGMGMVPTAVVPGVVLTFDEQPDIYTTPQFQAFYGEAARRTYIDFMQFFGRGVEAVVTANGELLRGLVRRGALVGTGTDSPFTPFGAGLHAELRLYQRAGLAPHEILHAATYQSAVIAGVEHDLGTLEPGKLADLVVVDGDPLADVADADNVVLTVKDGRAYTLQALMRPER